MGFEVSDITCPNFSVKFKNDMEVKFTTPAFLEENLSICSLFHLSVPLMPGRVKRNMHGTDGNVQENTRCTFFKCQSLHSLDQIFVCNRENKLTMVV